ncbi:lysophospholipid acyltransferase family protein [Leekyejoonella antrihumi]|uniref:1-acyl-sn-glycerol-3-phosphate acyltransferase n=1 Tax=Leekyejoonella antrihumi TaxID=1660198 RepID=A0A563E311_9MICO|nr:lysophospholipid acyltransferase family protein [Leekyejoonella antrihumi]TWP36689.1 1-acyl-sn-glycerol-3-phosphate acyltransferase [Leekyejoonella antrihumi]
MSEPTGDLTQAPLASPGRRLGWFLMHVLYEGRALHGNRIPRTGPVIVISNHSAFLDGPVVFCLAPRTLHFLVKSAYFSSAWGAVLRKMGQIPIDQHSADRRALMAAKATLERGDAVGIFPEGHRGGGTVEAAEQGAAWLALQTGALIVPAATLGTRGTSGDTDTWPRPRGRIRVVFGEPFAIRPFEPVSGRERLRLATEQLRSRLAAHVQASVGETGMGLPAARPGGDD